MSGLSFCLSCKGLPVMLWTLFPARSNGRVAALIHDAFRSAALLDPDCAGLAPRDVAARLRFAMRTDAGAFHCEGAC